MPRSVTIAILAALLLAIGSVWIYQRKARHSSPEFPPGINQMARELGELQAAEEQIARTVFADELRAQELFRLIEELWDRINHSSNRLAQLNSLEFDSITLPKFSFLRQAPHEVALFSSNGSDNLPRPQAVALLQQFIDQGWQLARCEFRHNAFTPIDDASAQSKVYFAAHFTNPRTAKRSIIDGDLTLGWNLNSSPARLEKIDASNLHLRTRQGPPPFQELLALEVKPPQGSYFIDPLIVFDLDGDGYSEIILAAANLLLRRQPDGSYAQEPLCPENLRLIFTAIIGDFTGNGTPDLLTVRFEGIYLYEGSDNGKFQSGRLAWTANPRINYGQVLTAGDIDADGDLDLWLGQYKPPYSQGQMPAPYYDANDGYPSFLLENDGNGTFKDVTHASGLGQKRWRRAYSGSFADLDNDDDLDLVVVSDFAGVDAFENQGNGKFKEASEKWFPAAKGFGMAHLLTDLNSDGWLDFFMVGMNSPAADRLNHLKLQRPGMNDLPARREITFGNRLFLGTTNGFTQPSVPAITRTGWSWGAASFDSNNDGFQELYIANGHETREQTSDYEPEFWLHDIYVANSETSTVKFAYFQGRYRETRGRGKSYGGYELNRFFLNEGGTNFIEAAHLLGIASQADSRNVVSDDLDNDGRMDLILTTFEVWPSVRQVVYVYANQSESAGNWVGFQFKEQRDADLIGAKITIKADKLSTTATLLTGDSYRSQARARFHSGLGAISEVESVQVEWSGAAKTNIAQPKLNQWNTVGL